MEKSKLPSSAVTNQNLNVPQLKTHESESEQSSETNETIVKSTGQLQPSHLKPPGQSSAQSRPKKYLLMKRKESEWEIVEGLKTGHTFDRRPDRYSGFLHKKRKWPLKGWHKRYFVLDNGILTYAKSENDIARGKLHGTIDIGMSVISTKEDGCRLDIDTEEFIYHMKAKTIETFRCWADKLKDHRLYRQHILVYGREPVCNLTRDQVAAAVTRNQSIVSTNFSNDLSDISIEQAQADFQQLQNCFRQLTSINSDQDTESLTKFYRRSTKKLRSRRKQLSLSLSGAAVTSGSSGTGTTVSSGLQQYDTIIDNKNKGLSGSNTSLTSISNDSNKADAAMVIQKKDEFINISQKMLEVIKKLLDSFLNERKRLKSICEVEQSANSNLETIVMLQTSLNKSMKINSELRDQLAKIHQMTDLKNFNFDLIPMENYETSSKSSETNTTVFYDAESYISTGTSVLASPTAGSMCTAMASSIQLLQQEEQQEGGEEEEAETSLSNQCFTLVPSTANSESSSIDSLSSEDVENSLSSNDNHSHDSVQGVRLSDHNLNQTNSIAHQHQHQHHHHNRSDRQQREQQLDDQNQQSDSKIVPKQQQVVGRRTKLPVPKSDTGGFPLWNVLYKNIGKDLTQISMPVHLNEPLNTLQKLCEELEYSELIEKAAECESVTEQMVYVAAFAVSAYTNSLYRTASKPFNPLLGETYECVRDDKGFKFVAEQVSHHPAISACHAGSDSFEFWQDIRIKSKFWGKSMEIQPIGFVNLYLKKTRSHYRWNKVTTCIHNLFNNSKRWVDQYGELTICNQSQNVSCRLTFEKASYWSSKKHEFYGDIIDADGSVARKLFGRWSEGVYCDTETNCVWRPNPMPDNFEQYFGFSQFAIELNELSDDLRTLLPCTDTRFRPDQRALEEGRVDEADDLKSLLESKQRERRKENERLHTEHKPRWFLKDYTKNNEEFWKFSGEYWQYRENRNFSSLKIDPLW